MQGDARACKRKSKEARGRGKRKAERAGEAAKRRKKKSISAYSAWSSVLRCGLALMLFCAFGCFPCPLCFLPLAPSPCHLAFTVALPSHSPRIRLLLSPRIPLAFCSHSLRQPFGVWVSGSRLGCRVGVSGSRLGCRGLGSGVGVSAWLFPAPLPASPARCLQTKKFCVSSSGELPTLVNHPTYEVGLL